MINDALLHLHSNMERFKGMCRRADYAGSDDLHSNMERFKGDLYREIETSRSIYIPIWRDLKQIPNLLIRLELQIYIPIWRDLKERTPLNYIEMT